MRPRRSVRGWFAIAAVALVPAGLGACGGGGKSSGQKLGADFTQKVDAVCGRAQAGVDANGGFPYPQFRSLHPDPNLLPRVGAFLARDERYTKVVPAHMRALGEPTASKSQWDRVRSLMGRKETAFARQVAFAKRSDAAGFAAETTTATRLHDTILSELRALGFSTASPCLKFF